jgi:ATP adenylyltransferase
MIEVPPLVIPGITSEGTIICISRARRFSQYCKMVEDALAVPAKCPFCPPLDPKYNEVITENEHWWVWQSKSPEKNTAHHFLFVPKRHVADTNQLTEPEMIFLFGLIRRIKERFNIVSCGLLIRDGDARLSAGTIEHLHVHLMVPDGKGRVESPFFKGAEAEARSMRQAVIFEKVRTGTKFEDLPPEEQALVKDIMD